MNTSQTSATRSRSSDFASGRLYRPRRFNKQSKQRFERNRLGELVRHLGREPSYPEKIILSRVVAIEWDLVRTDSRLDAVEEPSGHLLRARLASETRLRLDLAALGLKPTAPPKMTLDDYLAQKASAAQAA
jgi:hypothetical protein